MRAAGLCEKPMQHIGESSIKTRSRPRRGAPNYHNWNGGSNWLTSSPRSPMTATGESGFSVVPSGAKIFRSTPTSNERHSIVALSVSTSAIKSSRRTSSPSLLIRQRVGDFPFYGLLHLGDFGVGHSLGDASGRHDHRWYGHPPHTGGGTRVGNARCALDSRVQLGAGSIGFDILCHCNLRWAIRCDQPSVSSGS